MPLSDREQKILEEIEKNLHSEDPRFAREVGGPSRTPHKNNIRLGLLIFFLGLGLLIAFFVSGALVVGVIAFGTMVGGIVIAAGSIGGLANSGRTQRERFSSAMTEWERKLRERYKRR